jgi:hypothetical protein
MLFDEIQNDGVTFVNDLLLVDRDNIEDRKVVNLLQLFQSFDSDNNASNGINIKNNIVIPETLKGSFPINFTETQLDTLTIQNSVSLVSI